MASKVRFYIKLNVTGVVNSLLISVTDNNNKVTWTNGTDTDEIYQLLVDRNTTQLRMSNQSPFTMDPSANAIVPHIDNGIVHTILDGIVTHVTLGLHLHDTDNEIDAL